MNSSGDYYQLRQSYLLKRMNEQIKSFFEQCQAKNGQVLHERPTWNEEATLQAIRHFSICVSDDNPL